MNKSNLPKNWIVCSSKSYPDKVYYFNTVTNKTSWELPLVENQNEASSKDNTKKRKLEKDPVISRPVTPDMMQEKERPVLQAKRRISLISQKTTNETPQMREIRARMLQKQASLSKGLKSNSAKEDSSNKKSTDKRTLRNENSSNIKDSKDSKISESTISSPVKQKRRFSEMPKILSKKLERRLSTVNSNTDTKEKSVSLNFNRPAEESLTPQMRLMYEKLKERNSKKNVSSKKSLTSSAQSSSSNTTSSSSSSISESSNVHSPSSSSSSATSDSISVSNSKNSAKISNSEKPLNLLKITESSTVSTRRKSRLSSLDQMNDVAKADTSSLPTLGEEMEPDDRKSKEKVAKRKLNETLTSARKSGRTIFLQSEEPDTRFKIASQTPTAKYPKNIAKQRLDDIRESLTLKNKLNESLTPEKHVSLEVNQNYHPDVSSVMNMKEFIKEPGPEVTLYTNATSRAKNVRDKVLNYQSSNANVSKHAMDDFNAEEIGHQSVFEKLKDHNNDPYYEEMEWEPIEDEKIMYEVQAVRSQLFTKTTNHENILQENVLELSNKKNDKVLYIVVDTNVFLSNLSAIEEARDTIFKSFGRPFIVVPWTVIQELDFIKDDRSATRSENLRIKSRKAVRFLHQHFSSKHPRILGQTPQDVMKNKEIFETITPDDEILQSCLQIRHSGRAVVLLSYDKNLCTKAMIHDIVTIGRDDHFEKIDFLKIDDPGNSSFSTSFNTDNNDNTKTALEEELLIAEDIFEKAKDQLRIFLSPIVVSEMRNLFGDGWERYTIIKPPWSAVNVLQCAIKHWMAAVSESFMRIADSILKELLDIIKNPPAGGRKLKDVNYFMGRCSDLMQTLNQHKYPNLLNKIAAAMDVLRKRCLEETSRISEKKIRDEIGYENNIARQNDRAELALEYFNKVYAFTRDFCGSAAKAIDMPCTIVFEKTEKIFNENFVKDYQPVLAANLNQLLQLLSLALEDINGLRPDHKAINVLTEALITFLPDDFNESSAEITSLDLYYLIKTKQDVMKRGLMQLQDLSQLFCRMASFRCK